MPCVVVVVVGAVVVVAVVVAVVVGALVGAVVGTTVRVGGGGVTGGTTGVEAAVVGAPGVVVAVVPADVGAVEDWVVLALDDGDPVADVPGVVVLPDGGGAVSTAAPTGGMVCFGLAATGSGISGVSSCGPPSRLLAMSTR
ncbi:hypothetical protein [Kribbella solani]|uniref:Uncharacterized protein n=1 Tax=Kribbella solani TaxID=236067 RepID=A0A841DTH1_9ACTN|nr:hypothetical protein [Kribbella solani]MBB5981241.1 hypothetical protein [Kribbella solani]